MPLFDESGKSVEEKMLPKLITRERCEHEWERCKKCGTYICTKCKRKWFGQTPPDGLFTRRTI